MSGDDGMRSGTTTGSSLEPGQSIKPNVSPNAAQDLVLRHFAFTVTRIKELNSYDDNNFYVEVYFLRFQKSLICQFSIPGLEIGIPRIPILSKISLKSLNIYR